MVIRVLLSIIAVPLEIAIGEIADGIAGASISPSPPSTFVVIALYLAIIQFLVAKKGLGWRATWPTLAGMLVSQLVFFFLMLSVESREVILNQGVPGVIACFLGAFIGAVGAGTWKTKRTRV